MGVIGMSRLKLHERGIKGEQIITNQRGVDAVGQIIEIGDQPAMVTARLRRGFVTRELNQNVAHRSCGGEEDVPPIVTDGSVTFREPEECLMHEGRRLKRLPGSKLRHPSAGEIAQLVVERLDEFGWQRGGGVGHDLAQKI